MSAGASRPDTSGVPTEARSVASSARLAGKRVLITGGTSGIGRAIVVRFLTEGASVAIAARRENLGRRLVDDVGSQFGEGRARFWPTDVGRPEQVRDLVGDAVDWLGGLDVVVSTAGIYDRGTAAETDEGAWERTIRVDLSGTFYLAKHSLPHLVSQGSGSLVLTASELGLVGTRASVAYCAAKGGVINLTRALAVDCAGTGVRVNCMAPGPVDTPLLERGFQLSGNADEARRAQLAPLLTGRFGTPDEIANVALFLASDESTFMTGSVLVADGGATSWYGF